MASFGNFETDREVYSDPIHTVYGARKQGDDTPYAVKVFSIQRIGFEEEARTELQPLMGDLERARVKCIEIQRKTAETSAFVAPVLETGYDERGVWYATRFFPRSVNRIISGRVALTREPLLHILRSITHGALDLKRTCGRSHGDIQPSNVQISKSDQLTEAEVVLSDPMAGGEEEAVRYEIADLRAIGQILLQLVRQRAIGDEQGFLILPILASPEWTRLFGKDTERWLALCNQLLDPKLSLDHLTLEKLLAQLEQLEPKRPVSTKLLVTVAAAVVLLGGAAFLISQLLAYQKLRVTSDPPGAAILVNGKTAGTTPLTVKLKKGNYGIQARHDTLRLLERSTNWIVGGGAAQPLHFQFAYGSVALSSDPPGASITNNGVFIGKTPFTIPVVAADVPVKYELSLSEHGSRTVQGVVTNGRILALSEKLPLDRESGTVDMESTPRGAQVFWNGKLLTPESGTPAKTTLEQGPYTLTAVHPDLGTQQVTLTVTRGEAVPAKFYFPSGRVTLDSTPQDAVVWVGTNRIGNTPIMARRPVGKTSFRLELPGYETNFAEVTVADKGVHPVSSILKILAGFVEVSSDPPGAEILDLDRANKVVAVTKANGSVRIPLPPGKTTLGATYGDLKALRFGPLEIKVGQPTPVPVFAFEYGTVVFSDVGPADVQDVISIQKSGKKIKIGERVIQRPAEPASYEVEAPGYEPVTTNVMVAAKDTKPIRLALMRKTVPVKLTSDPPGARFFTSKGTELRGSDGTFSLPWGKLDIIARYGRLGTLTNSSVPIQLQGPNSIPPFKFEYGKLVLTNLPDGYIVKEGEEELVVQPGNEKFAYERPGMHKYDVYEGNQKSETIATNILTTALNILRTVIDPNLWQNSKQMKFQWVAGLPGGGLWTGKGTVPKTVPGGLVSQYEISQGEYKQMNAGNPSTYTAGGDKYPVENVTWAQAVAFCQWLNQTDTSRPQGWGYTLPSDQQYLFFARGADLLPRVSSEGIERDKRPTHPEQVGSKQNANFFHLYDVVGNVAEWVFDHDADPNKKDRFYRGGSYLNFTARTVAVGAREGNREKDSNIGFRVVLVPGP